MGGEEMHEGCDNEEELSEVVEVKIAPRHSVVLQCLSTRRSLGPTASPTAIRSIPQTFLDFV